MTLDFGTTDTSNQYTAPAFANGPVPSTPGFNGSSPSGLLSDDLRQQYLQMPTPLSQILLSQRGASAPSASAPSPAPAPAPQLDLSGLGSLLGGSRMGLGIMRAIQSIGAPPTSSALDLAPLQGTLADALRAQANLPPQQLLSEQALNAAQLAGKQAQLDATPPAPTYNAYTPGPMPQPQFDPTPERPPLQNPSPWISVLAAIAGGIDRTRAGQYAVGPLQGAQALQQQQYEDAWRAHNDREQQDAVANQWRLLGYQGNEAAAERNNAGANATAVEIYKALVDRAAQTGDIATRMALAKAYPNLEAAAVQQQQAGVGSTLAQQAIPLALQLHQQQAADQLADWSRRMDLLKTATGLGMEANQQAQRGIEFGQNLNAEQQRFNRTAAQKDRELSQEDARIQLLRERQAQDKVDAQKAAYAALDPKRDVMTAIVSGDPRVKAAQAALQTAMQNEQRTAAEAVTPPPTGGFLGHFQTQGPPQPRSTAVDAQGNYIDPFMRAAHENTLRQQQLVDRLSNLAFKQYYERHGVNVPWIGPNGEPVDPAARPGYNPVGAPAGAPIIGTIRPGGK